MVVRQLLSPRQGFEYCRTGSLKGSAPVGHVDADEPTLLAPVTESRDLAKLGGTTNVLTD